MKDQLDLHAIAYEGQNFYDYDNTLMLNWYPQRIIYLTQGRKSILELGIGHGFATKIFSKHFHRHVVFCNHSGIELLSGMERLAFREFADPAYQQDLHDRQTGVSFSG